jgi:hypothetical protein
MEDSKVMHDATWVGGMLYGQRTQFTNQGQSYLKGQYQDLLERASSVGAPCQCLFPILVMFRRHVL